MSRFNLLATVDPVDPIPCGGLGAPLPRGPAPAPTAEEIRQQAEKHFEQATHPTPDGQYTYMLRVLLLQNAPKVAKMLDIGSIFPTAPAAARKSYISDSDELCAFEKWLFRTRPSGNVDQVQHQWISSDDYAELLEEICAPRTQPKKYTGGVTGDNSEALQMRAYLRQSQDC